MALRVVFQRRLLWFRGDGEGRRTSFLQGRDRTPFRTRYCRIVPQHQWQQQEANILRALGTDASTEKLDLYNNFPSRLDRMPRWCHRVKWELWRVAVSKKSVYTIHKWCRANFPFGDLICDRDFLYLVCQVTGVSMNTSMKFHLLRTWIPYIHPRLRGGGTVFIAT